MRTYGIDSLKTHIRNHFRLGDLFHTLILSRPDLFYIVTEPAFAVVLFTVVPPLRPLNVSPASNSVSADGITKEVHNRIKRKYDILLLGILVDGTYAIRVCCAIHKAEEQYIRRCFEIVVKATEEVLNEYSVSETCKASEKYQRSYRPESVLVKKSIGLAESQTAIAVAYGIDSCEGLKEKMPRRSGWRRNICAGKKGLLGEDIIQ